MDRRSFLAQGLRFGAGFCLSSVPFITFADQPRSISPTSASLAAFRKKHKGPVYGVGDPEYERLRKVQSAKVDQRPALIVHSVHKDDVSAAVRFAAENQLSCAVRCGGHSYAGYSTCEGGLVVDVSGLRDLAIRPGKTSALVGTGLLSGVVEIETAKANRAAVLGQCPSVGTGGFLLGGGVGPLMSKYGLGCDNVLAADLVLADGRQVNANKDENPDLYWAIRGGGGNFGVVTSFEVSIHPVSEVFAGNIVLAAQDPADTLRLLRDFARSIPDELTLIATMSPDREKQLALAIQACYIGATKQALEVLAPLRRSKMAIRDGVRTLRYLELEQQVPAVIPRAYNEHRGGFLPDLDDSRISVLMNAAGRAPGAFQYSFIHLHGAPSRIPIDETAFALRSTGYAFGATASWQPISGGTEAANWVSAVSNELAADTHGGYVNLMDREDQAAVQRAYGANYRRLSELKARYDPQNIFRNNQNILPARDSTR